MALRFQSPRLVAAVAELGSLAGRVERDAMGDEVQEGHRLQGHFLSRHHRRQRRAPLPGPTVRPVGGPPRGARLGLRALLLLSLLRPGEVRRSEPPILGPHCSHDRACPTKTRPNVSDVSNPTTLISSEPANPPLQRTGASVAALTLAPAAERQYRSAAWLPATNELIAERGRRRCSRHLTRHSAEEVIRHRQAARGSP